MKIMFKIASINKQIKIKKLQAQHSAPTVCRVRPISVVSKRNFLAKPCNKDKCSIFCLSCICLFMLKSVCFVCFSFGTGAFLRPKEV